MNPLNPVLISIVVTPILAILTSTVATRYAANLHRPAEQATTALADAQRVGTDVTVMKEIMVALRDQNEELRHSNATMEISVLELRGKILELTQANQAQVQANVEESAKCREEVAGLRAEIGHMRDELTQRDEKIQSLLAQLAT